MKKHSLLIISGAAFWGTMGIFSRTASSIGFTTMQATALRIIWAAVLLMLIILCKDKKLYRISARDLPLLAALGTVSVFLMSYFYLSAIAVSSMSVAAILLYTSPFFVTAASAVIYREKITVKSAIALLAAFTGCVLIAGIGGNVTVTGLIYGISAGLTYASYSILGKIALKKYSPYTITLWAFIFAAIAAAIAVNPIQLIQTTAEIGFRGMILTVLMGLVTAVIPFLLYTLGLSCTAPGKASIMATAEPLVATLAGIAVFREKPTVSSIIGIALIIFAIALLNNFGRTENKTAKQ